MVKRCMNLAKNGLGTTYPNPLVGCVIVCEGKIISEAWHQKAGNPHAEALAIQKVKNKEILKKSTLYVSLEPCAHYGKTPPCSDLIIDSKIPKVVIATIDPFSKVNGLGIQKLKNAGIDVNVGIQKEEALFLNKRFITFHQHKRPYVILKWAQTQNGYMASLDGEQKWITNHYSKQLVHKWRTEEQAILVGTHTAKYDNPQLNARLYEGNQPIRVVIDRKLSLNKELNLFDHSQKTIVFTEQKKNSEFNLEYIVLDFGHNLPKQILNELFKLNIQSLIVEGGKQTLQSFIDCELWDEAPIFTSNTIWKQGVLAPQINENLVETKRIGNDNLSIYKK